MESLCDPSHACLVVGKVVFKRREVLERLQAEQAEMLDHERTKREEWESVQVLHFLKQKEF